MGRIAESLVATFRNQLQNPTQVAEEFTKDLPADVPSPAELADEGYDPQHIAYIAVQNFACLFGDAAGELDGFEEYARVVEQAEDEYLPSAPPMSPITQSFFWSWALFDLRFGADQETLGSCLLELMRLMDAPEEMLFALEEYGNSRMGIYECRGTRADKILLRELVTGDELLCHSASGYGGRKQELWYVRLAPPLSDDFDYHVALTTPYVLTKASAEDWTEFLRKQMVDADDDRLALHDLLKYGNECVNWMEFVFQAYHHFRHDAVFLAGIPGVPASLPHSPEREHQGAVTATEGDKAIRVKFSEAQRKLIARLWPELTSQLRLDEKKVRIVELRRHDLDRISKEGPDLLDEVRGHERTSLRKVIEIAAAQPSSPQATGGEVYQFRIVLAASDPPIWRRIEVEDCTLEELHFHIQAAMGWECIHLHQFEIDDKHFSSPSPFGDTEFDDIDDSSVRISQVFPVNNKVHFKYLYDFGDDWEHLIELEGIRAVEAKARYPRCTEGEQACPPEDCGGIWGFYEFVAAITDRKHPEHQEMMDWCGPFKPHVFDKRKATREMQRWGQ